jgi:hypothetical protein
MLFIDLSWFTGQVQTGQAEVDLKAKLKKVSVSCEYHLGLSVYIFDFFELPLIVCLTQNRSSCRVEF